MASAANSAYLPPRDVPQRARGGRSRIALHELINLSLIGKQLHWAVVGPLARPVHLYLDELVDSWRELADTVAERAVALGFVPDGQVQAVATGSKLSAVKQGAIEDDTAVREMTRHVVDVVERVRARLRSVGETDLISQDVLIDVVRTLEKQQWLLRVQIGELT